MNVNDTGRILVVDDSSTIRAYVSALLHEEGHEVRTAINGNDGLLIAQSGWPDLVLTDINMPEMDGYQLTRLIKSDPASATIPVIIFTSNQDNSSRIKGLSAGAEDFLTKPIDPVEVRIRARNLVRLSHYYHFMKDQNKFLEKQVSQKTQEIRNSHLETIMALSDAIEYRDELTGKHVARTSLFVGVLAIEMGLELAMVDLLTQAMPLHDIGKIGIPDAILHKNGPLTPEDLTIIKSHCEIGAKLLSKANSIYLKMGAEIALGHHEKWNGSGYPHGLKGQEIPLSCRIAAICDQYDALRSDRPYKQGFTHEETMNILLNGDTRTKPDDFDPEVINAFIKCHQDFARIYTAHRI